MVKPLLGVVAPGAGKVSALSGRPGSPARPFLKLGRALCRLPVVMRGRAKASKQAAGRVSVPVLWCGCEVSPQIPRVGPRKKAQRRSDWVATALAQSVNQPRWDWPSGD